jgi:integrase
LTAVIGTSEAAVRPVRLQLSLGLLGVPDREVRSRSHRARPRGRRLIEHCSLTQGFQRRLAATGASRKTQQSYVFQLERLLVAARRLGLGQSAGLAEVFHDQALLGSAIIDDRSSGGARLSRWTLAQRRAAVRAFARLMAPELRPLLGMEPEAVVIGALRRVAERVGGGYRLSGGQPRRRGGRVPTPAETAAILAEAARAAGFKGKRNRAFLTLLRETGSRVNALRELQGRDILILPNGRVRLMLHAKGQRERREVEVSQEAADMLFDYIGMFNREAGLAGSLERVSVGQPGPVWRSSWRLQWAYPGIVETFEQACLAAGVHAYRLHSIRRAFATDAASILPRHVVARAGGWQGLQRLDNHYIQPRADPVLRKLRAMPSAEVLGPDHQHAAVAL